jgi:hypothetical protein
MRALLTCLLIACAGPAQAMNWEGHDDWMADAGPALLYKDAVPEARTVPPPPAACRAVDRREVRNPYEQIPLQRPDCRGREEEREVGR